MTPIYFDLETADPDDIVTLCLLATHPRVALRGVSVIPGAPDQIGLVRRILTALGRTDVRIAGGISRIQAGKTYVSGFHEKWFGAWQHSDPDGTPFEEMTRVFTEDPATVLLTGARLTNPLYAFNNNPDLRVERWVGQGGFAGDSVVPEEHRLEKFKGKETCATFNFGGDVQAAEFLLTTPRIKLRHLASKNVCHGVLYDEELSARIEAIPSRHLGLDFVHTGMSLYLKQKGHGKALHDLVAAAVAIDPTVCDLREVELYRQKGEWGSKLADGTNTWISVNIHRERFIEIVTETV